MESACISDAVKVEWHACVRLSIIFNMWSIALPVIDFCLKAVSDKNNFRYLLNGHVIL